jgi:serine/threonine protein kinase
MDEPLQKTLERYDVLDRIAVGGMAEVFLAKAYGAHGFEKTLAIKKILPELARDPEFEARFIAEAKVAVKLSHANVVQVFDFGRIGESLFIAMEFVDGLDLAALIRKFKDEKRLVPLPAAFHIAIEIVRALDFAHQHNVVHRDVSPSNILISRAGEVKIGDFGIAVAAAPHRSLGKGVRKVMGKWRYMSPEQTRGDLLDTRSDLFSAASVLFELFTGEKLFPGEEAEDIIKNIESMPIPRASQMRKGLPSRLDDILAGPLSRKPIDRPIRPAVMLRSLIELSYESSIMATALDVAEAVSAVLPPPRPSGPGTQLDDVIRKQLGAAQEKSVARQTAVTSNKPASTETAERRERGEVSTGLFRRIGDDGLSRLEEVDPHGATGQLERPSLPALAASSPDSGLHKLLDAHFDPDRRTEVGGPPTGQVPKSDPSADASQTKVPKSVTTEVSGRPRRSPMLPIVAVAVVVAAGGAGAWFLLRDKGETKLVTNAPADAGSDDAKATLEVVSDPAGARVSVIGPDGKPVELGVTPVKRHLTATKMHVRVELAGYAPFDDEIDLTTVKELRVRAPLQRARATLHVVTVPSGAQVSLAGKLIGETDLTRDNLDVATGVDLVLTHAGFEQVHQKIDLVANRTTEVSETLKASQKMGQIRVSVSGGWGDIYFKGVRIGRSGPTPIRLPVGVQTIQLRNPGGAQWHQSCRVEENEVITCTTKMP